MSIAGLLRQESAAWKAEAERAATEIQALRLENEALRLQMKQKVTEAAALGILTASEYENKAKQPGGVE